MTASNSERAELVDAIRRAPGADAPRYRAAEWFEKQGDEASVARAAFIRAQLALSSTRIHDAARAAHGASELRLLKRWAKHWADAHPLLSKVSYRRGFAEYAHVHVRKFLPHRRELFALEPIRDVRVTGYYRPHEELARAIGRCAEWQHVETLRFHHQGPHHEPRAALLHLLESPHLEKLRKLYCTRFQFDADDRRRFERLPLLERIDTLSMPTLDWFPSDPGPWFSEGWETPARWSNLRSLALWDAQPDVLRQWTQLPWWPELRELELWATGDALDVAAETPLASLTSLTLSAGYYRMNDDDSNEGAALVDSLRESPLTKLDLRSAEGAIAALADTLSSSRWSLESLRLPRLDAALAESIASARATHHLHDLAAGTTTSAALEALASDGAPSLQTLSLSCSGQRDGVGAAEPELVARFLRSPMCANLNALGLGVGMLDASVARAIESLEHLSLLSLTAQSEDTSARARVNEHMRDRWYVAPENDEAWPEEPEAMRAYVQRMRAASAPDKIVPLDAYIPRLK